MKRKLLYGILGGLIGLVLGFVIGGYFGLIIGGTFLGSFDIYKFTGLEGYELTLYIGAIIGGVILSILGIRFALRAVNKKKIN